MYYYYYHYHTERALIITGLHNQGLEAAGSVLAVELKKQGNWDVLLSCDLPQRCALPSLK
jgi:hypothetical protein